MDTIECLKKFKVSGVIHSFSGSLEMAREFVKEKKIEEKSIIPEDGEIVKL